MRDQQRISYELAFAIAEGVSLLSICAAVAVSLVHPDLEKFAIRAGLFWVGGLLVSILLRDRFVALSSEQLALSEKAIRRSFLADFLLPVKISNDLHANLDEAMPLWIAAHGERRALWIRRSQQAQTIAKYWMTPLRNLFQAVFKLIR